ncbi:hypothetical protein [Scytonema sp. PCC 10023]|uniref:hypothetical protein n=1 Tax=Scytonema sp. PCC 10023 TaxID=1680591 RepID=UPI0039C637B6
MTLAFSGSTSSLSQKSLEDIFLPFLSDTSSQQWENTDFQALTSENFYTKSAWESSQEKLTQALSGLIPEHRRKECEDYHQEVNNALDGLEEEIILLYDKLASLDKQEQQKYKTSIEISFENCRQKCSEVFKVLYSAPFDYSSLPNLPHLLYLSFYVLRAGIKLDLMHQEKEGEGIFASLEGLLVRAMTSAFERRKYLIQTELSGPFKNLIYIYDHYLQQSLTNWVESSEEENARKIDDALLLLGERIADSYVQDLQCDQISSLLTRIWGRREAQTWAKVREDLIIINKDAESQDPAQETQDPAQETKSYTQLAESTQEVALDWVKMSYIPELQPASVVPADSSILQEIIIEVVNASLERFLESTALRTSVQLIAGAVGGVFASAAISAIFSLIWPPQPPLTAADVDRMINERVERAVREITISTIHTDFRVAVHDYNGVMAKNPNHLTLTSWFAARSSSYRLQLTLLDQSRNAAQVHYQVHQLVDETTIVRLNVLLGALDTAVKTNQPNSVRLFLDELVTFINTWYNYLDRLARQSYLETRRHYDMHVIHDWWQSEVRLIDNINNRAIYAADSHWAQHDHLSGEEEALRRRVDFFVTLSTQLHNLCRKYDTTSREIQRLFDRFAPTYGQRRLANVGNADRNIFANFLMGQYERYARYFWNYRTQHGNVPDARLRYQVGRFGPPVASRNNNFWDWNRYDYCVQIIVNNNLIATLSVGDYPDVTLLHPNLSNGIPSTARIKITGRGLVAAFYQNKTFSGTRNVVPSSLTTNFQNNTRFDINNPRPNALSIKVRIDAGSLWFPGKGNSALGRLRTDRRWETELIPPPIVNLES